MKNQSRIANLEGKGLIPKSQIFSRNKTSQKDVDALSNRERQSHYPIRSRLPVKAADKIRQIIQHAQVVLHYDDVTTQAAKIDVQFSIEMM